MQAKLLGHSLLLTHSGLQKGGWPTKLVKQEHDGIFPFVLHSECGPHGDGWHGFLGSSSTGCGAEIRHFFKICLTLVSLKHWNFWNLRIGKHLVNGSPVYLGGQLHIGLWLTTWHLAFNPQVPGQGSMHFWLTQAWFNGQSELTTHSGLHDGGVPIKLGTQVQTAWPFTALHWLFGPHGDGLHGFISMGSKEDDYDF